MDINICRNILVSFLLLLGLAGCGESDSAAKIEELVFRSGSLDRVFSSSHNNYTLSIPFTVDSFSVAIEGVEGASFDAILSIDGEQQVLVEAVQPLDGSDSVVLREDFQIDVSSIPVSGVNARLLLNVSYGLKYGTETRQYSIRIQRETLEEFAASAYLKAASSVHTDDEFGYVVDTDGQRVVVGVPYNNGDADSTIENPNNLAENAGAVFVFNKYSNRWNLEAMLKAPNAESGDLFGYSVAIEDDIILVGAIGEDSTILSGIHSAEEARQIDSETEVSLLDNNEEEDSGAVYFFQLIEGQRWEFRHFVKGAENSYDFGSAVDIFRDSKTHMTFAMAPTSGELIITTAFRIMTFDREGFLDSSIFDIYSDDLEVLSGVLEFRDYFGKSISLSNLHLAVGAPYEDNASRSIDLVEDINNDATDAGAVFVFSRATHESQTPFSVTPSYIKAGSDIDHIQPASLFGYDVSIDGNFLYASAPNESSRIGNEGDAIRVSPLDNRLAENSGAVYVYSTSDGGENWVFSHVLKAVNGVRNAFFGYSIDAHQGVLAIGAYGEPGNSISTLDAPNALALDAGAVYTFRFNAISQAWESLRYLKAPNAGESDYLGQAIAIRYGVVVAGASGEDGSAGGSLFVSDDNVLNSGAVYVFD